LRLESALVTGVALVAGVGFTLLVKNGSAPQSYKVSYATSLYGRSPNQQHNARLSSSKINGTVIQPGEVFSFVKACGTWSRDQGYRRAPVSFNGVLIDAWGGGVCQTSTTLYNAALLAGLEILERTPHQFAPTYAPPGRDAAVAYSSIDLKFRNTTEHPITIYTGVKGDMLEATIKLGAPLKEQPKIETKVISSINPGTYKFRSEAKRAYTRNAGKNGWEVITYRRWSDRREKISQDSYPVMHRVSEE
jgi:vancomycin resistance protein VanW